MNLALYLSTGDHVNVGDNHNIYIDLPYIWDWMDLSIVTRNVIVTLIGCSNWDMSRNIGFRFNAVRVKPQSVHVLEYWDVSNVVHLNDCFTNMTITNTDIGFSKWDTHSVRNTSRMFYYTRFPKGLYGIENWDMKNVKTASYMFFGVEGFIQTALFKNWHTKVRASMPIFSYCVYGNIRDLAGFRLTSDDVYVCDIPRQIITW